MARDDNATLQRLQVIITGNTSQLEKALKAAGKATKGLQVDVDHSSSSVGKSMDKMARSTTDATAKMQGGLDKVGSVLKKVAAIAATAVGVKAIISFGKSCVDLGSDLTEVQNVVDVTFGSLNGKIDKFAKNSIKQFGLSETAAKQYSSTMGAMLKSMGFTVDSAYEMSTTLTGLAGDIASFYNLDADEAFSKIRSGISGETEPLKQLGINMSVANLEAYALSKGIKKAYSDMSQMEQATLRYSYLLSVTGDAQGDFARTSGEWANQTRILSMRFESIKAHIGQGLIMAFTPVLKIINAIIEKLSELSEKFHAFMAVVTGNSLDAATDGGAANLAAAAVAAEDVADGLEDADKAKKKFLMSFDEIHKLGESKDDSEVDLGALSDSSSTYNMEALNDATEKETGLLADMQRKLDAVKERMQPVIDKAKELSSQFKSGFEVGIGGDFTERAQDIITSAKNAGKAVRDIFLDPEVQASASNYANTVSYAMGQVLGSVASIGLTIGTNLIGGFEKYITQNKNRVKKFLTSIFDIKGDIATMLGGFAQSVAEVFSVFGEENGQTLTSNIIGIFTDGFMGAYEIASKVVRDIIGLLTQPFVMNTDGIRSAIDDVLGFASSVTGTIKDMVDTTADILNGVYDAHLKPLFDSIAEGWGEIVGTFLRVWQEDIAPVLEHWGTLIQQLWQDHIKPVFESFGALLGDVFDAIKYYWETYLQPIVNWLVENLIKYAMPIINSLFETLISILGHLFDALKGVFDFFSGIINIVIGILTGDFNKALGGVKKAFGGIIDVVKGLWNIVTDVLGGFIDLIWNWVKSFGGLIARGFSAIVDKVKGFLGFGDNKKDSYVVFEQSAQDVSGYSGVAATAMNNTQLTTDDIETAFSSALSNQPQGEVAIYLDGEEIGRGIDSANSFRNTRLNPVMA